MQFLASSIYETEGFFAMQLIGDKTSRKKCKVMFKLQWGCSTRRDTSVGKQVEVSHLQ